MSKNFDITAALDPNSLSFDATLSSVDSKKSMQIEDGKITNVEHVSIEVGFIVTITHELGFYLTLPMRAEHSSTGIPVVGDYKGIDLTGASYKVVDSDEDPVIYFSKENLSESYVLLALGSAETTLDEDKDRFELRFKGDTGHKLYNGLKQRLSPKQSSDDGVVFSDSDFEHLGMVISKALETLSEPGLDANPSLGDKDIVATQIEDAKLSPNDSKSLETYDLNNDKSDANPVTIASQQAKAGEDTNVTKFKQPSGANKIEDLDKNSGRYNAPVPSHNKDQMVNVESMMGD